MVTGGNDTTTGMLGGAVQLLHQRPDQRRLLADNPELIPDAVDEFLRLTSPVQCLGRTVTRDIKIHDTAIPGAGECCCYTGQPTATSANTAPMQANSTSPADPRRSSRSVMARTIASALPRHECSHVSRSPNYFLAARISRSMRTQSSGREAVT